MAFVKSAEEALAERNYQVSTSSRVLEFSDSPRRQVRRSPT